MPISRKGTVQQYAGRLHRLYVSKQEVQIYDYVDEHVFVKIDSVPMLVHYNFGDFHEVDFQDVRE